MIARQKIILYGGGAVIGVAVLGFLFSPKPQPSTTQFSSSPQDVAARSELGLAQIQAGRDANALASQVAIAQIAANSDVSQAAFSRDISLSAITAQAFTDTQAIDAGRTLGIAQIAGDVNIAGINASADVNIAATAGNTASNIALIEGNTNLASIAALSLRDAKIIEALPQVRKKERDDVLKTLIAGYIEDRSGGGQSKAAQVIGASGGIISSIGKLFGK